jgi:hypothetical protein
MVSEDVVKVAPPALSGPDPSEVAPSENVTVPVGVPPAVLVTVAVNVTDWPPTEGLSDEVSNVALGFRLIICMMGLAVLEAKFGSPPYCAVIEWEPTASEDVANIAMADEFNVPAPIDAPLSKKVTIPVGVPLDVLVTVAVNVTDAPPTAGFILELTDVVVGATTQCARRLATSIEPRPVTSS